MIDRFANFYNNLAGLISSGFSMTEALEALAESEPQSVANGLRRAITTIHQGGNLEDALTAAQIFNLWEIQVLVAGERTGHLPEICKGLSQSREQRAQRIHEVISRSIYPIVLVHLAILGPSLGILVSQGSTAYWDAVLPFLGGLYALFLLPWILLKVLRQIDSIALILDHILLRIPIVGGCLLKLELSQSMAVLQSSYTSGITIRDAIGSIIKISKNRVLKNMFQDIHDRLMAGDNLTTAIKYQVWIPSFLKGMIASGETAGKLDEQLLKAQGYLEHEATTTLQVLISALCTMIFIFAALIVAYKVISFYSGYMSQIQNLRIK